MAVHDPRSALTSDVDAEFLALVCADEELLDAEFEAIVAALGPPPRTPPANPEPHCPGAGADVPSGSRRGRAPQPKVRRQANGRERSPPS